MWSHSMLLPLVVHLSQTKCLPHCVTLWARYNNQHADESVLKSFFATQHQPSSTCLWVNTLCTTKLNYWDHLLTFAAWKSWNDLKDCSTWMTHSVCFLLFQVDTFFFGHVWLEYFFKYCQTLHMTAFQFVWYYWIITCLERNIYNLWGICYITVWCHFI